MRLPWPALVYALLPLRQRLALGQLLKDVVEPGERQVAMRIEYPLAMRVELFREIAGYPPLRLARRRKREGIEATAILVARIIPDAETSSGVKRPGPVGYRGQDPKHVSIVAGDGVK